MHANLDRDEVLQSVAGQVAKLDNDSASAVTRPNAPAPARAAAPPASVYNRGVPSGYERFFKTFAPEALAEQAAQPPAGQAGEGRLDARRAGGASSRPKQASLTSMLGRLQPREPSPILPVASDASAPTDRARLPGGEVEPLPATKGNACSAVHDAEGPLEGGGALLGPDASKPGIARPVEDPDSGVYGTRRPVEDMGQQSGAAQGNEAYGNFGPPHCELQHGEAHEAVGASGADNLATCSAEGDVGMAHATCRQPDGQHATSSLDMQAARHWPGQGACARHVEAPGKEALVNWSNDWDFLGDDPDRVSNGSQEGLSPASCQLWASPVNAGLSGEDEPCGPAHGGVTLNSFRSQTGQGWGPVSGEGPVQQHVAACTPARECPDRCPNGLPHERKVDDIGAEMASEEGHVQEMVRGLMPAVPGQPAVRPDQPTGGADLVESTEGYMAPVCPPSPVSPEGPVPRVLPRLADMSAAEFARLPVEVQRTLVLTEAPAAIASGEKASAVAEVRPSGLGGLLEGQCAVDPEYGTDKPPAATAAVVSLQATEGAAEDRPRAASLGLPSGSQIDTSVLDALPLPLKREMERALGKSPGPHAVPCMCLVVAVALLHLP